MSKPKLALIPSGYKSGKVYSILPNDASGDFDFTRQSIGTRVRKDGLIEEAKTVGSITNELLYSEEFTQSFWLKTNSTITANDTLAPNGTNTADKIIPNTSNSIHQIKTNVEYNSSIYTYSIYAKKDFYKNILVWFDGLGGGLGVNLDDSSIFRNENIQEHRVDALANGWYRISITANITTNSRPSIYVYDNSATPQISFAGNGVNGLFIWGAMLSEGALSDYIKTEGTTETKTVETFTDVPRLDWYNSNCPSLLLEPQRLNSIIQSQDLNTSWSVFNGGSISSNEIIAPNGELEADELITNGTGFSFVKPTTNPTISTGNNTFTIFAKKSTSDELWLRLDYGTTIYNRKFNLSTQTISTGFDNTANIPNEESIENYGNGWYRLRITDTADTTSFEPRIYIADATSNNGDSVYLFGAQVEQGSYPTSYIKTEASAVTRLKDECYGGGTADLFNDNEGVLFLNMKAFVNGGTNRFIQIHDGSYNNAIGLFFTATTNRIVARVYASGSFAFDLNYTVDDVTQYHKYAFKYKSADYQLWVDGTKVLTNSLTTTPTGLNQIGFLQGLSGNDFFGKVKDLRYFDNGLTDTELTELTK